MEEARAKLKATGIFIHNGIKAASADGRTFAVVNPFNKQVSRKTEVSFSLPVFLSEKIFWAN